MFVVKVLEVKDDYAICEHSSTAAAYVTLQYYGQSCVSMLGQIQKSCLHLCQLAPLTTCPGMQYIISLLQTFAGMCLCNDTRI